MEKPICINMHDCRHKCYTTTPHLLFKEKCQWVAEARKLLQAQGKKGTRQEIAELLGVSESWVKKYGLREGFVRDEKRTRCDVFGKSTTPETPTEVRGEKLPQRGIFWKKTIPEVKLCRLYGYAFPIV